MNSTKNIVLTGFMGTGKSTVSQILAQHLHRQWVDMDALIERRTGYTIPQIFTERGEPFFRTIEQGMCFELSLCQALVISTGGGALMNVDNRQVMLQTGFGVCLTASPATLESRLSHANNRPLASRWREILAEREAIYRTLPHQISTDDQTPDQVAQEIITLWNASQ